MQCDSATTVILPFCVWVAQLRGAGWGTVVRFIGLITRPSKIKREPCHHPDLVCLTASNISATSTSHMESTRKSIIVTGGASGIGLAISRHFLSHGHRIAILDINADVGSELADELAREYPAATVVFKKCDVASWEEQSAVFKDIFVEHGGRLDIVVANAGIAEGKVVTVVDFEEDEPTPPRLTTLEINLIGVIYCGFTLPLPSWRELTMPEAVKLAAHYMNKKPADAAEESRGSIICTASNVGLYPLPTSPLYSTSKFGVVGLVRSLAYMLSKAKIQINALAPSLIGTCKRVTPDPSHA
jgi:NAD(P)-dependent dehydrogenase (short-subunit alcohol dehydrogenase family)